MIAKKYEDLELKDIQHLLNSKIHEERSIALTILVKQFKNGDEKKRKEIYELYLKNTKNINNWDLVDLSCHKIVGPYLEDKDKAILSKLAKSKSL
jgi:3-methyladenine DNA glycosylase AlkD